MSQIQLITTSTIYNNKEIKMSGTDSKIGISEICFVKFGELGKCKRSTQKSSTLKANFAQGPI